VKFFLFCRSLEETLGGCRWQSNSLLLVKRYQLFVVRMVGIWAITFVLMTAVITESVSKVSYNVINVP